MELTKEIQKLIKADIRKFATSVTETTNNTIKNLVIDTIGGGGTKLDLQKTLGIMFDKAEEYRAKRIAETETQRFNNSASEKAFIDSEIVEGKEWFVNPGACEFCKPLQGKTIGLGKSYFKKGDTIIIEDGSKMTLDYDSTEHPPLHPNCLCVLIPVFKQIKSISDSTKKKINKEVIIVEIDDTKKEYELKIEELKKKMKDIEKIKEKTKEEKNIAKKERKNLVEFRKKIVEDFNNQQDVK